VIRLKWNPADKPEWQAANDAYVMYVKAGMIPFREGKRVGTFDPAWGSVEFRFRPTGLERSAGDGFLED